MRHLRMLILTGLAGSMALLAGCQADLPIREYPSFYDPDLRTVAVAPFANDSLNERAGQYIATRLARALEANRTYKVIGPTELASRLADADLAAPADGKPESWARLAGKLEGVQAVLTGRVDRFSAGIGSYLERESVAVGGGYGWHGPYRRLGGGLYAPIYVSYPYAHARVAASVQFLQAGSGSSIHNIPGLVSAECDSRNDRARTPEECLAHATDAVASRILDEVAIVDKTLKIQPDKALRTATGPAKAPEFTDDIPASAPALLVVLDLPASVARNRVVLEIAADEDAPQLARRELTWPVDATRQVVSFEIPPLLDAHKPGRFVVRLEVHGHAVTHRDFEIRP